MCQPFPRPSRNDLLSRSQSSARAEWCPPWHAREGGRQASRPRNCSEETSFLLPFPLISSSFYPLSPTLWTFYPSREKFLPPLGDSAGLQGGRQAGEAQTTCMQLGPAWRGGEQKALKDRTGQSQTDGRTDGLALPPLLPLAGSRPRGREGECSLDENAAVALLSSPARPPARPLAPTLTCSKSYLGRASQRSFRSEPCLVTTLHIR